MPIFPNWPQFLHWNYSIESLVADFADWIILSYVSEFELCH